MVFITRIEEGLSRCGHAFCCMSTQSYSLECILPVARDRAWEVLANTDRLNQKVGLPSVLFAAPAPDTEGQSAEYLGRAAQARLLGVPLRWVEQPFEWVRGESYSVLRTYEDGALKEFRGGVRLYDQVEYGALRGTRAQLWAEVEPRSARYAPLVSLLARQTLHKTRRYCEGMCVASTATMHNAREAEQRIPGFGCGVTLRARLRTLEEGHCEVGVVRHLERYLREATDNEVCNIRPYELAARWGFEREQVLSACLQGAQSGLLALRWNLMCPNCRVAQQSHDSLGRIESQFHCDWCGISYNADFGRSVELRFAAHPAVRRATPRVYCIGSPAHAPHVLAQVRLQSGTTTTFEVPRSSGAVRLRVLRANHSVSLGTSLVPLLYTADGWRPDVRRDALALQGEGLTHDALLGHAASLGHESPLSHALCSQPDAALIDPSEAELPTLHLRGRVRVRNSAPHDIVVALENEERDTQAVTAARVAAMPEFRAQFGAEVLSPGVQVGLENAAILFSDLRGSTAFYEQAGDAPAYGRIRDHFDILTRCINEHEGVVVKTMGDAVMAIFTTGGHAVRAALCMQEALRPWLNELEKYLESCGHHDLMGEKPALKVGVHCGPVIVVNNDGHLDYFGRTVNLAARLQHLSNGNDLVISQECRREAETDLRALTAMGEAHTHHQRVNLRGFEESFDVWRLSSAPEVMMPEPTTDYLASFDPHVFDAMLDALHAA